MACFSKMWSSLLTAVTIATLYIECIEAECKCDVTPGGGVPTGRIACCENMAYGCDWVGNPCQADREVHRRGAISTSFSPLYPAYFNIQLAGSTHCSLYNARNIIMNEVYVNPHTRQYIHKYDDSSFLSDSNLETYGNNALGEYPFNDDPSVPYPFVRVDEEGEILGMNVILWPYIAGLHGLKLYPLDSWGVNLPFDRSVELFYFEPKIAGEHYVADHVEGGTVLFTDRKRSGAPITVSALHEIIQDANFRAFTFVAASSKPGWSHDVNIFRDQRNPDIYWYTDPAFPILSLPIQQQNWTIYEYVGDRIKMVEIKQGTKRVGIKPDGTCNSDKAWCHGIDYKPYHKSQVVVARMGFNFKIRGSQKLVGVEQVIHKIIELQGVKVTSRDKTKQYPFMKKMYVITKPSDDELIHEFIGPIIPSWRYRPGEYLRNQWHRGSKTQRKALLVRFWPNVVIEAQKQQWIHHKKEGIGYWSDDKTKEEGIVGVEKKKFLEQLKKMRPSGDPGDLSNVQVRALKKYEITIYTKHTSAEINTVKVDYKWNKWNNNNYLIQLMVDIMLLVIASSFCLGLMTGYFMHDIIEKVDKQIENK